MKEGCASDVKRDGELSATNVQAVGVASRTSTPHDNTTSYRTERAGLRERSEKEELRGIRKERRERGAGRGGGERKGGKEELREKR